MSLHCDNKVIALKTVKKRPVPLPDSFTLYHVYNTTTAILWNPGSAVPENCKIVHHGNSLNSTNHLRYSTVPLVFDLIQLFATHAHSHQPRSVEHIVFLETHAEPVVDIQPSTHENPELAFFHAFIETAEQISTALQSGVRSRQVVAGILDAMKAVLPPIIIQLMMEHVCPPIMEVAQKTILPILMNMMTDIDALGKLPPIPNMPAPQQIPGMPDPAAMAAASESAGAAGGLSGMAGVAGGFGGMAGAAGGVSEFAMSGLSGGLAGGLDNMAGTAGGLGDLSGAADGIGTAAASTGEAASGMTDTAAGLGDSVAGATSALPSTLIETKSQTKSFPTAPSVSEKMKGILTSTLGNTIMDKDKTAILANLHTSLQAQFPVEVGRIVERSLTRKTVALTTEKLMKKLMPPLAHKISDEVSVKSLQRLSETMTPAITHSVAYGVTRAFRSSTVTSYLCYYCRYGPKPLYCEACIRDSLVDYGEIYLTNEYAKYYSEYYGTWYALEEPVKYYLEKAVHDVREYRKKTGKISIVLDESEEPEKK